MTLLRRLSAGEQTVFTCDESISYLHVWRHASLRSPSLSLTVCSRLPAPSVPRCIVNTLLLLASRETNGCKCTGSRGVDRGNPPAADPRTSAHVGERRSADNAHSSRPSDEGRATLAIPSHPIPSAAAPCITASALTLRRSRATWTRDSSARVAALTCSCLIPI